MRRFVAVLVTASVVSSAVWAATRPSIPSAWRTADIQIDGNDAEWTSTLAAVPAPSAVASMSVENDATHVFVRIRTSDPATMQQIVRGGLLVWFDAKGGDAKTFGIKYPVGTPPPNPDADQRPTRDREQADSGGQRRPGPPLRAPRDRRRQGETPEDLLALVPNRLEVYGPKEDDIRSLVLAYATGLSVSLARAEDGLVYELKVPLQKDAGHPYAIGTTVGASVGFGLQSPRIASAGGGLLAGMAGMAGGGMGGGRPGGGQPGGGPPPRGGEPGSGDGKKPPAPPKPFVLWQTLVLAKGAGS